MHDDRQQPGLAALREEAFRDDPEGRRAYHDSALRANLAARLKLRRRRAGLTLRQLAKRLAWSPEAVDTLESATRPWPSLPDVRAYLRGCRRPKP